jgi:hypothetical protein
MVSRVLRFDHGVEQTTTMSKIFDALRKAESSRASNTKMSGLYEISTAKKDRRRSRRREVRAAIQVYGHLDSEKPFYEEARSINVSKHGALLNLDVPVREGQKLLLFDEAAKKTRVCEIVATRSKDGQSLEVAVTFLRRYPKSQRDTARRSAAGVPVI